MLPLQEHAVRDQMAAQGWLLSLCMILLQVQHRNAYCGTPARASNVCGGDCTAAEWSTSQYVDSQWA